MQKHILRLTIATLGFTVPVTVFSAAMLHAQDTVAGLGAEITASGLAAKTQYELVVVPPEGREEVYSVSTDTQGKISKFIPGSVTEHAGMYDVIVAQGVRDIAQSSFEVLPDTMDATESFIDLVQDTIAADGRDEAEVIVVLMDRFGNPLPSRPVELIGSGYETVDPIDNETDRYGEQHFIVTTRTPGPITLRAMDLLSAELLAARAEIAAEDSYGVGGHTTSTSRYRAGLTDSASAQEEYDVINRFKISIDPATLEMREVARNVLIQAVDRNGNIVRDYTGTVRISSPTDPTAVLPGFGEGFGETTFTDRDRGEKNLRLVISFQRAGEQTLKVEDLTNPAAVISGSATVNVTSTHGSAVGGATQVTSHTNGDT
ncbi:MAG TPA: Ig-like domain-containing protein, partial [Candidatus Peribacteraceae bacterium]|nr:Ig-like domain-containing protein [Candidatus Peribacteraceae bacterium]